MIASLRGTLRAKSPAEVVVECGGVGYGVVVPLTTYGKLPETGTEVTLLIHTHVREELIQLFGFWQAQEKSLFQRLIAVSGIGPKLAVAIMSGVETSQLVGIIQSEDVKRLTQLPGVGRKTAERIVLELRDKLQDFESVIALPERKPARPKRSSVADDVVSALTNLGYKAALAEQAVSKAEESAEADFEPLLREALRILSPS